MLWSGKTAPTWRSSPAPSVSCLGARALPAVRAGLRHNDPDVRFPLLPISDRYLSPDTQLATLQKLQDGHLRPAQGGARLMLARPPDSPG